MPTLQIAQTYLSELRQIANAPNATEHSYRPSIATLVKDIANQLNRPLSQLILEPGNVTTAGAPDVVVYGTTTQRPLGGSADQI